MKLKLGFARIYSAVQSLQCTSTATVVAASVGQRQRSSGHHPSNQPAAGWQAGVPADGRAATGERGALHNHLLRRPLRGAPTGRQEGSPHRSHPGGRRRPRRVQLLHKTAAQSGGVGRSGAGHGGEHSAGAGAEGRAGHSASTRLDTGRVRKQTAGSIIAEEGPPKLKLNPGLNLATITAALPSVYLNG